MIKIQEIDNIRTIFRSNGTKLDTIKKINLHFKMFQNISLIVCLKKATKCVRIYLSQNDLNGVLDVGVCQIYLLLNCL